MFRVFIGRGPMGTTDLETRIDDWVASNTTWDGDSADHTLSERTTNPDGDGETYYAIDVRFEQTDAKDNLLQKVTDKLENKVAWYRVGYHACGHDERDGGPCSWDDVAEWTAKDVTIPDGVPSLTPA